MHGFLLKIKSNAIMFALIPLYTAKNLRNSQSNRMSDS